MTADNERTTIDEARTHMSSTPSATDRTREWADLRQRHLRPRPRTVHRPSGVHHVALLCSDVPATIEFYQGVLGFPLTELFENRDYTGSTHFFFDIGNGNALAFFDFPGLDLGPYGELLGGLHHLAISVPPARLTEIRSPARRCRGTPSTSSTKHPSTSADPTGNGSSSSPTPSATCTAPISAPPAVRIDSPPRARRATMSKTGSFNRDMNYIGDRITADAGDGWPVEAGRYRLVVAHACPWANRSLITHRLLGLDSAISVGIAGPLHDPSSWNFHLDPDGIDPVLGIHKLQEAFFNRYPDYPRGITVPAIVDIESVSVVTNDFPTIEADLSSEWSAFHRDGAPDLWPETHRDEIEEISELVFHDVNNGVYKCGFASTQEAYEQAYDALFARLDWLEEPTDRPPLPRRRHHHPGRHPTVDHPRPLRRRLPQPLQVQPEQADRDARPLGLRPGPPPDTRLRRHHRLPQHQGPLLRRPHQPQPEPYRPQGSDRRGLADRPWPGGSRRPPLRPRHRTFCLGPQLTTRWTPTQPTIRSPPTIR